MQGPTSMPKHSLLQKSGLPEASCLLPPSSAYWSLMLSLPVPSDFKFNRDDRTVKCGSHFPAESPWGRCQQSAM